MTQLESGMCQKGDITKEQWQHWGERSTLEDRMASWPCSYIPWRWNEHGICFVGLLQYGSHKGRAFKIELYCLRKELLRVFLCSRTNSTLSICSEHLQGVWCEQSWDFIFGNKSVNFLLPSEGQEREVCFSQKIF